MGSIGTDHALIHPADDQLGYRSFAQAIAETIGASSVHEGLVTAVYGPWGSGKSTLLNFIEHDLSLMAPGPEVVRFNPWWFSGQEAVTRQFLLQLALALQKRKILDATAVQQLGEFADELGTSSLALQVVGAFRKSKSRKLKDLSALREDINRTLKDKKQPVVVFIDDVDRLTGEEIRQLFGVIKAVADFPFVTYLLAFDRRVVSSSLSGLQGLGEASEDYVDKIVQVPFELPLPDGSALRAMFFDRLEAVRASSDDHGPFDRDRWVQIFWSGIDDLIATPRDAVRFTNSLSVTYPAVAGLVNPVDFIAIEAVRVFAPEVYDLVRTSRDEFAGAVAGIGVLGGAADAVAALKMFHEASRAKLKRHPKTDAANRLVDVLFPKVAAAFGSPTPGSGLEEEWRRTLRICSPDMFDIYFRLAVPTGHISPVELRTLLSDDGGRAGPYLLELAKSSKPEIAQGVIDRLNDYAGSDEMGERKAGEITLDLFDVGDELLHRVPEPAGVFEFGIDVSMGRLIRHLLRPLSEEARYELLLRAVTAGRSLYLVVREVALFGQEHEEDADSSVREPMVTAEHANGLMAAALKRVRAAAASSELIGVPHLLTVLYQWMKWSDASEPRAWVAGIVSDDDGLATFLKACLNEIKSESLANGAPSRTVRHILDPQDIEPFVDPAPLVPRAAAMQDDPSRPPAVQLAARTFVEDAALRAEGKDPRDRF